MKTALILEDHVEAQRILSETVQQAIDGIAVQIAPTISIAQKLIATETFDFALIDISLPDGNGIRFVEQLKSSHPHTVVVMATIYADDHHLFSALRAGAQGYILKEQSKDDMVRAIKGMLSGHPPLAPSIAQRILSQFSHPISEQSIDLTPREVDVLTHLARGGSRKIIAAQLNISTHTVSDHIKSIYAKLNVHSSAEAVFEATQLGLV